MLSLDRELSFLSCRTSHCLLQTGYNHRKICIIKIHFIFNKYSHISVFLTLEKSYKEFSNLQAFLLTCKSIIHALALIIHVSYLYQFDRKLKLLKHLIFFCILKFAVFLAYNVASQLMKFKP